jgi:hypothetical protein
MEQPPNNLFHSLSAEQKLVILRVEMLTPLAIIQGCAVVLRKHIEAENTESAEVTDCINGIAKSADKIKELLDELTSLE